MFNIGIQQQTGITGLWLQELDAGRWTLDSGLRTLDSGLWTLDPGRWTLEATETHKMFETNSSFLVK